MKIIFQQKKTNPQAIYNSALWRHSLLLQFKEQRQKVGISQNAIKSYLVLS
jgi:hypothetical protein